MLSSECYDRNDYVSGVTKNACTQGRSEITPKSTTYTVGPLRSTMQNVNDDFLIQSKWRLTASQVEMIIGNMLRLAGWLRAGVNAWFHVCNPKPTRTGAAAAEV